VPDPHSQLPLIVLPEHTLAEERLRDLLRLSVDWFWEMDADLRYSYFSGALEANGLNPDKFIGKHRWDLPIDLTPDVWAEHKAVLAAHRPFRDFEYAIHAEDGSKRWFATNGIPVFDPLGMFTGYRGTGRDITASKRIELELREHRDHLDDKVKEQTRHLVLANQIKAEFLANMSHELRTPMHAILSFARVGQSKAASAAPEKLKEYFDHIRSSGERLLDLVNDLLDLSKLEAGRMHYVMGSVDLYRHATEVVAELAPLFEAKRIRCEVVPLATDCHVWGDHKRIDQVLLNLLGNALKFSPEEGGIRIEIAMDHLPSGRRAADAGARPGLRLSVSDAGPGIPEEELESIFNKFSQSSRTQTGAGGTGLGLTICREIVHAHRGIIRASNRSERGATFDVILPLIAENQP
jgi:PAS domain S-box-containing protein